MDAISESLDIDILRLRSELELHAVLDRALQDRFSSDVKALTEFDRRARRMTYASVVVGCYGLIEQTMDQLLIAVAECLNEIYATSGDLPETVRVEHRRLILECLRNGDRVRTRVAVDELIAIAALAARDDEPSNLVPGVFTYATANYRYPYSNDLLARLSMRMDREPDAHEAADALNKAGFASYESFLEDLVQRRNELAHSYAEDAIVNPDLLEAYVSIVAAYLRAVVRHVDRELLARVAVEREMKIGSVVKVWTGRVGIEMSARSISVGDRLLLVKSGRRTLHRVASLQSEGEDAETFSVDGPEPINVSAQVELVEQAAEGSEAFVVPEAWLRYWIDDEVAVATQQSDEG